jgi:methylglutaconyl-CoA hydratase
MTPASWHTLDLQRSGAVARIEMQRPELHNAFDARLVAELTAALREVDSDPAVRAVVLTGAGATFSAGADLNWMRAMAAASAWSPVATSRSACEARSSRSARSSSAWCRR